DQAQDRLATLEEEESTAPEAKAPAAVQQQTQQQRTGDLPQHHVAVGQFLHKGTKNTQEDAVRIEKNLNGLIQHIAQAQSLDISHLDMSLPRTFVALLDGHAGDACMKFVRTKILPILCVEYIRNPADWCKAMERTILSLEAKWAKKVCKGNLAADCSGTTLTTCVMEGAQLHCAWTGDSPCWIQKKDGTTVQVSSQHRPGIESEKSRIERAGGEVRAKVIEIGGLWCLKPTRKEGPLRVFPSGLNISRSIGDIQCKNPRFGGQAGVVIADPETVTVDLEEDFQFLVLSSDGLSDNLNPGPEELSKHLLKGFEAAFHAVREEREEPQPGQRKMDLVADLVAERCVYHAMRKNKKSKYQDNTSALVCCLLDNIKTFDDLDAPGAARTA
ncbi:Protein phosphatase 1L (Protein phosphatase 1-like) (Protein phosphatase 2C isoform epsilon) (PP2C-epsilon), partial [Durusdinium trenchii]